MSPDELKTACEEIFAKGLKISSEEAAYLEESTRLQSQCCFGLSNKLDESLHLCFEKLHVLVLISFSIAPKLIDAGIKV